MAKSTYAAVLFVLFTTAAHANLIVNGGFETGDFTGWTQSGWFIDTTNPHSGVYDASTGCGGASCTTVGDPNSAFIAQTVATTVGTTYNLSFFYDSGQLATAGSELLVLWGDPAASGLSTVVDFVDVDTSGLYTQYTGTVTATSATSELELLGRQDLDFYSLDDVWLTAATTTSMPEPGTLSGLLAGLLFLAVKSLPHRHLAYRVVAKSILQTQFSTVAFWFLL